MSVQYLSDQHFSNAGGRALRCNLPGITFVMFKTDTCDHCNQLLPIFQQLARQDMRITWAVVDVSRYRNIVTMSKMSSTPIRAVPMMILYVDGRPHANYKGKRHPQAIMGFLDKILSTVNTDNHSFSQPTPSQNPYPQPTYQPQSDPVMPSEDVMNMPKNVIPHNAPYLAYKSLKN